MNGEIAPKFVEKPWGCEAIPALFRAPPKLRIGEIWFEPPAELSGLLLKFLFTSEKLSVQVHPTDQQAEERGLGRKGKHECWLVLDAQRGASLGIGFRRDLEESELRAASLDGRIADLLQWHDVEPGDFFYIPANTVHAVGPGLILMEVQQNSDVTYRLYDYGRGRELHLEDAASVAKRSRYPDDLRSRLADQSHDRLVEGPFFRVDCLTGKAPRDVASRYGSSPLIIAPLAGTVSLGASELSFGKCGVASDITQVRSSSEGKYLIAQPLQG